MTSIIGNIFDIKRGIVVHAMTSSEKISSGVEASMKSKFRDHYNKIISAELGDCIIDYYGGLVIVGIVAEVKNDGKYHTDYEALRSGLVSVQELASQTGFEVFIPHRLACDHKRGQWNHRVKPLIEQLITNAIIIKYFSYRNIQDQKPSIINFGSESYEYQGIPRIGDKILLGETSYVISELELTSKGYLVS